MSDETVMTLAERIAEFGEAGGLECAGTLNTWGEREIGDDPLMTSSLEWTHLYREGAFSDGCGERKVYAVRNCGGPDLYGTDLISEANFEVLTQDFPGQLRTLSYHNRDDLCLLETDPVSDELWEILVGLGDYPLIDDGAYIARQEREVDNRWEWDSERDLRRAIEAECEKADIDADALLGEGWDDDLYDRHRDAFEALNLYEWEEDSDYPCFYPELVADYIVTCAVEAREKSATLV